MKLERELSAAIGIPAVLALLFFAPAAAFGAFAAAIAVATLFEFLNLAQASGTPVARWIALAVGAAALVPAVAGRAYPPAAIIASAFFAVAALLSAATLASGVPVERALASAAVPLFGIVSIVFPFCGLIWLDRITVPGAGAHFGPRAILFALATVWGCDSAAYYVGRKLGRRKLAPVVSPKKTVEGTLGGFVGSLVVSAAASLLFLREFSPLEAAAVGGIASSAGQVGDLIESMFKRGAGVKDSGIFLPGHGGFYDRVDSLLFALPVVCAAVWWKLPA